MKCLKVLLSTAFDSLTCHAALLCVPAAETASQAHTGTAADRQIAVAGLHSRHNRPHQVLTNVHGQQQHGTALHCTSFVAKAACCRSLNMHISKQLEALTHALTSERKQCVPSTPSSV
jgi:hypothetical protein